MDTRVGARIRVGQTVMSQTSDQRSRRMANATSVILAVNQQKGGTGKTTTTACLGDALQRFLSKRVLLVDLDRQASLTDWLVDPFGAIGRASRRGRRETSVG